MNQEAMKPGKEICNPNLDSENRSGSQQFFSRMTFFLAALGIIVGVVYCAQREIPMGNMDQAWIKSYSYWFVFKFSGPLAMLSFLIMLGCLARSSFQKSSVRSGRFDLVCLLPLLLGGSMAFLLLTGAWRGVIEGGLDADIGTRYRILESKLQLLVGAISSSLCFTIIRLKQRNLLQ